MSGDVPSAPDSPSLLREIVGQWKLWLVAVIAVALAVLTATFTEGALFRSAWFALVAVGSALFAVWRIDGLSVLG